MTAVEFLVSKLNPYGLSESQTEWFEQAKEMEKQQIIDFANSYGFSVCGYDYDVAEDYYNQQFKNK